MELRPRVALNAATGTVSIATIAGSGANSGLKFELESISAGAEFSFEIFLMDESLKEALEAVLAELKGSAYQIGGQKSNGQGYIKMKALYHAVFDMTMEEDRIRWANEDSMPLASYQKISDTLTPVNDKLAYSINISGKTEGALLVKSIAVTEGFGEGFPDAVNLRNGANEYIVPGSSLKGVLKSRIAMIAEYYGMEDQMDDIWGTAGSKNGDGRSGCIHVADTVVGSNVENDMARIQHHIHIDKFTGGVMNGSLFSERNVSGDIQMRIGVNKSPYAEAALGLLILAVRDLAAGAMNVGSGYASGKGFMDVEEIRISTGDGSRVAVISDGMSTVADPSGLISECCQTIAQMKQKGMK